MLFGAALKGNLCHPYNRRRRFDAAMRYLEWKIRCAMGRPWDKRFWGDRLVTLFPDSSESMWLLYNVVMDWPEFPFLESYLRRNDTVIDIGANIGVYALWMSRFLGPEGKLIAFEPSSQSFARLAGQMRQNGLDAVVLEKKAVADRAGRVRLTRDKDMENRVLHETEPALSSEMVEAVTLDQYLQASSIAQVDFLKIDVEGAEPMAIDGAELALRDRRIAVIQFEVGEHWHRYGGDLAATADKLGRFGYTPFVPDDSGKALGRVGDWSASVRGQNLFVTRSVREVSERLGSSLPRD